jgi:mycoredoxin
MRDELTLYSTPWCGFCHRLKGQLEREGINFTEVDIEKQPDAAFIVERVNDGNRTVPTVVFGDGSALTNPSVAEIKQKLAL